MAETPQLNTLENNRLSTPGLNQGTNAKGSAMVMFGIAGRTENYLQGPHDQLGGEAGESDESILPPPTIPPQGHVRYGWVSIMKEIIIKKYFGSRRNVRKLTNLARGILLRYEMSS